VGVGISIFVLSLVVVIMIIPTVHSDTESQGFKTPPTPDYSDLDDNRHLSYEEKLQKELDRLLAEYKLKEPDEGGPPDEKLIDFQELRLDEIRDLEYGILELDKVIDIKKIDVLNQEKVIQIEKNKIAAAEELLKKEWGSPPVNTNQLKKEYEKLIVIQNKLGELLEQKELIIKQINSKKLIYDIQKHDAKLIGVTLGANCIAMAKINMTSCPTYEDLIHLDDSLTATSGGFSFYDGYFHREKSNYQDSYRAYDNNDKIRIIIDPPQNEAIRMKMITIVSNLGYYSDPTMSQTVDGQRLLSNERIISNCYTADISAKNWKMLLPDTIFTFRNGCESAEIDDVVKFEMPKTEINIWSSQHIKYQHWVQEMTQLCKVKC
tara:strand:+ start:1547 stop:2677 length:1131 start_codon:yes stop_codon:yes gene_type:complete